MKRWKFDSRRAEATTRGQTSQSAKEERCKPEEEGRQRKKTRQKEYWKLKKKA